MKMNCDQLMTCLRRTLWTGGALILLLVLSLVVCGLLALVGDHYGRAAALVLGLVSFLGLILDLAVAVGILSLIAIRNHEQIDAELKEAMGEDE